MRSRDEICILDFIQIQTFPPFTDETLETYLLLKENIKRQEREESQLSDRRGVAGLDLDFRLQDVGLTLQGAATASGRTLV
jgi:hypothetical protein